MAASIASRKRYHVHVYAVIRIKVDVEASDHQDAMAKADDLIFAKGIPISLTPTAPFVLAVEPADEITGYLVDEVGDPEFLCSRSYDSNHHPDTPVQATA